MLRPHPPGCGSLLVGGPRSLTMVCDWQSIGVTRYVPDGPARVQDLMIYLAGWALRALATSTEAYFYYVPGSGLQGVKAP